MIWEGFRHRICAMPEITGHKGEPDHFPDETQRERTCSFLPRVAVARATRNIAFLVSFREEASAKAQKGGLTSTSEPCPNPMEANDVMGEQLRSQRSAPGP